MRNQFLIVSLIGLALGLEARAEMITKTIPYIDGDVKLQGFLAYDDKAAGPRPGVLVVHEWWGQNDYARKRARMLAELGYVALAVDMYGGAKVVTTPDEAGQLAGPFYKDVPMLRRRMDAALDTLKAQPGVDAARLGAIGYCFGGTVCLHYALGGAPVAGVVSFHGGLFAPNVDEVKAVKSRLLILHGADDPLIPAAEIAAFQEGLRNGGCAWEMVYYGGAVHSFTNPGADKVGIKGVAYHADADRLSWERTKLFFAELFANKP